MQTRSRREEVGIMLSFGGTPSHITRLLLYEGWILIGDTLGKFMLLLNVTKRLH